MSATQVIKNIDNYSIKFIDNELHLTPIRVIECGSELSDDNDIKHSTILKVIMNNTILEIKNYNPLLVHLIETIKTDKRVNIKDIIDKTGFNYKIGAYIIDGFVYREELGISIQYKASYETFKAIETLAKCYEYKLTLKLKTITSKVVVYEF